METGLVFRGAQGMLVGVLHHPEAPSTDKGVVIIVGGPQYRAGSHRHFVLLARTLTAAGFPVLRFDYYGMGDSDGEVGSFEDVDDDIRAAVDVLCREQPQVCQVVLWGLCDGASAALMYAGRDARVSGLVLLNPWARSERGEARAYLRYYYIRRLASREFWLAAFGGRWRWQESLRDIKALVSRASASAPAEEARVNFIDRMAQGWEAFRGRVLLILSGNDLTADEFRDWIAATRGRRKWLKRPGTRVETVRDANHTFARSDWRDRVTAITLSWLREKT
ncbi:MAG TPA: hydrolase 1, exosortase A system-associated [Gammaproteobacteria bacterium]|nr:hydrolase 1, exosortase A system-associated [Gammaproteobacteria bacterium]